MFGPVRGPWPDESWKGWWGEEPPYHTPVFVLTHHARSALHMAGGTVFHFVTDGIESALAQARAAAGDRDVRLGGGVATVREFLDADLVDAMHIAVAPVDLEQGERLWASPDDLLDRLQADGIHVALAAVALPNPASTALHQACGFDHLGTMREVGRKFDRWLDTAWFQKIL